MISYECLKEEKWMHCQHKPNLNDPNKIMQVSCGRMMGSTWSLVSKKNSKNLKQVKGSNCSLIILQYFLKGNHSIWGQYNLMSEKKEELRCLNSRLACSSNWYCQNHESEKTKSYHTKQEHNFTKKKRVNNYDL